MPSFYAATGAMKPLNLPQTQVPQAKPVAQDKGGFSFHDFLSIINPLQHLPVIGTLYRALTGDTIGTPEKIAGDTLYGGLWGAVAGIADTAFEALTGKDVGDTVLALFTGGHHKPPVAVAANARPATPVENDPGLSALTASLQQKGVDADLAQRALAAYRKSTALPDTVVASLQ
ncbi:MAG TPA: hypothetical protein VG501_11990 [Rhizomicrobium sp.]|nr:hypothetical protein [Rhizomicrobium sp.]